MKKILDLIKEKLGNRKIVLRWKDEEFEKLLYNYMGIRPVFYVSRDPKKINNKDTFSDEILFGRKKEFLLIINRSLKRNDGDERRYFENGYEYNQDIVWLSSSCKKIVTVTMCKNEADIIESFVRHCLTFSDEMIIVNHNSTDDTEYILNELKKELLPITIKNAYQVSHDQHIIMTNLMYEAFNEHAADIVFPLDVDEFLQNKKGDNLRQSIEKLDINKDYNLKWIFFEFKNSDIDMDKFTLSRDCFREEKEDGMHKKIAMRNPVLTAKAGLTSGNHYLNGLPNKEFAPDLFLAHFPCRGYDHYLSKICVNWMSNVAQFSRYTPIAPVWSKKFYDYIDNDEGFIELRKLNKPIEAKLFYENNIKLRYTNKRNNAIKNICLSAEKIANEYAVLSKKVNNKLFTAIILLNDDKESALITAKSIIHQSYKDKEIILFDRNGEYNSVALYVIDNCLDWNGSLKYFSYNKSKYAIDEVVKGDYIQLITSGDVIDDKMFERSILATEVSGWKRFVLYSEAFTNQDDNNIFNYKIGSNRYFSYNSKWLLSMLLQTGFSNLSSGISGFIIDRTIMEKVKWLSLCFEENYFNEYLAVLMLLTSVTDIGVFLERMIIKKYDDNFSNFMTKEIEKIKNLINSNKFDNYINKDFFNQGINTFGYKISKTDLSAIDNKKVHEYANMIKDKFNNLSYARLDIKFINKNVKININSSDPDVKIYMPEWFQKNGTGIVVENFANNVDFDLISSESCSINLSFKGIDIQQQNIDGSIIRVPCELNYKKITWDNKLLLNEKKYSWHNNPIFFNVDVVKGKCNRIHIEWEANNL